MRSLQSFFRRKSRIDKALVRLTMLALLATLGLTGAALAEDTAGGKWTDGFWEAFTEGKPVLNLRGRIELAELNGLEMSQAYTLRTLLGYGTKPWHGVSIYADMLNVASPASELYFNAVTNPNGKTVIADPTVTEVNQAWLKFEREDWLGSKLIGGRQRIILDDARFVGNVGWRQNEQTYDAVLGGTSLGVDDLAITYSWMGYVRRIFGDQDYTTPPSGATRDFRSSNHIINAGYKGWKVLQPTAFVYLLDLRNPAAPAGAAGLSSASYGLRGTGSVGLGEKLNLGYGASYAVQTNWADNPVDYTAHYVKLDLSLGGIPLVGKLAAGWEMLGSDNGNARFVTPLATLHAFNGWADVFLNNGGPNGLRDLYFEWAPSLPWDLNSRLIYHRFTADNGGATLGNEFDALLKRSFGKHFDVLAKSAYFAADDASALADIWRVWMEFTVKF